MPVHGSCHIRSRRWISPTVVALILIAYVDRIHAQTAPDFVTFQGFVTDDAGVPITNNVNITTTFYKNSVAGYTQIHPNVPIVDGIFHLSIGPVDTVQFDQPINLGIKLGADPEILPRTPLQSVPFALGMRGMYAVWADDGDQQSFNVIGGAPNNSVGAGVVGATIGGGGLIADFAGPNSVDNDFATVGGGRGNTGAGPSSTVGGGQNNMASGDRATVSGGTNNTASHPFATIGGGSSNTASNTMATIGGGSSSIASGDRSTIGGGNVNMASNSYATIGGGDNNVASGNGATASGGKFNWSTGLASTVPGGLSNLAAGGFSLAAGRRAKANHGGTFVWADSTANADFASTGADQFLIRAAGGVGIGTNSPNRELTIFDGDNDGDAVLNLKASNASARELLVGVNQSTGGIISMETNNNLQFRTDGTARLTIEAGGEVGIGTLSPDGLLDVNDVFKVQTHNTGAENQNARLFFSESNNNKLNGYSLIYAGDSPQTFDGTAFALSANELHFVRHDNLAAGNIVMSMSRTTGDITMANDLTVSGDLNVTGTKNFKIDHPLDPENKYLVHYALESDEVLNVYSGNVVTDAGGTARVELSEWFEALNRDFRYQLTVLGSFARATVAEEIANNGFTIWTDEPQVKVSWQISAVRDDPAARNRQPVEQAKAHSAR